MNEGHPLDGGGSAAEAPRGLPGLIDRSVGAVIGLALTISAGCICAIIAIGTWDTIGRIVNRPLLGAVEMTESLLAATIFLALPYAQRHYRHVVVDILYQNFRGWLKTVAHLIALIVTLAAFVFLFQQSLQGSMHAYSVGEVSSGAVRVPIWLAKIMASSGLFIAAVETLRQLLFVLVWPQIELARTHEATSAEAGPMEQG